MEENKKKKKKLTLTVTSKKPISVSNYTVNKQKTSVIIEKKFSRKKAKLLYKLVTVQVVYHT